MQAKALKDKESTKEIQAIQKDYPKHKRCLDSKDDKSSNIEENSDNLLEYFCKKRHKARSCPAFGRKYSSCGAFNHFRVGCKSKVKKPAGHTSNIKKCNKITENKENEDFVFD